MCRAARDQSLKATAKGTFKKHLRQASEATGTSLKRVTPVGQTFSKERAIKRSQAQLKDNRIYVPVLPAKALRPSCSPAVFSKMSPSPFMEPLRVIDDILRIVASGHRQEHPVSLYFDSFREL